MLQSATMEDFLTRLLGSPARTKVLRLMLFNATECFTPTDIAARAQVTRETARKELLFLQKLDIVKKSTCMQEEQQRRGRGRNAQEITVVKKKPGFIVNETSEYLRPLQLFVRDTSPIQHGAITGRLRGVGRLKYVVASGTFVDDATTRVDLLVVGDRLDERKLHNALRTIEAEMGRELRYAAFLTDEFRYRLNVYDKLVRDILDYPHLVLLDRIGVER